MPSLVFDEFLGVDKVKQLSVLLPLNAAEGILGALLGLNFKVKRMRVVVPWVKLTKEIS